MSGSTYISFLSFFGLSYLSLLFFTVCVSLSFLSMKNLIDVHWHVAGVFLLSCPTQHLAYVGVYV